MHKVTSSVISITTLLNYLCFTQTKSQTANLLYIPHCWLNWTNMSFVSTKVCLHLAHQHVQKLPSDQMALPKELQLGCRRWPHGPSYPHWKVEACVLSWTTYPAKVGYGSLGDKQWFFRDGQIWIGLVEELKVVITPVLMLVREKGNTLIGSWRNWDIASIFSHISFSQCRVCGHILALTDYLWLCCHLPWLSSN